MGEELGGPWRWYRARTIIITCRQREGRGEGGRGGRGALCLTLGVNIVLYCFIILRTHIDCYHIIKSLE